MTGPANRILDEDSFYQKIFEHARDSALVLEPDPNDVLTIRDANEAAIRAHGYSRRELIDRPIRFLDPFTDRAFLVEGVRNLVVSVERDITARKEMELKLKHSRDLMSYVIGHARSAIAVHDRDLRYIYVSERYLQEYNIKEKDVIGRHHYEVFPDLPEKWRDVHRRALRGEISSAEEDPYFRDDGSVEWTRWECRPWYEKDGAIGGIIVYTEVITDRVQARQERQALQDQLQQAVKMEAIGRLAGGVAHDFNNQLTCIKGNAEMSLLDLDPASPLARPLREINQAADSAAALTRQLLAFSRKEVIEPRPQDLNTVVKNLRKMLSRLIGEDVSLTVRNDPHLGVVEVDPAQFEQVLVNLAVNARDAMPEGGEITIETANQALGEDEARAYEDISPGHYVRLTVRDTGQGIPGEILAHIFEPFLTTKSKEKGLGLATVFGALKQAGGGIAVESAVGQGTSFTIVLPRIDDPAVEPPSSSLRATRMTSSLPTACWRRESLSYGSPIALSPWPPRSGKSWLRTEGICSGIDGTRPQGFRWG